MKIKKISILNICIWCFLFICIFFPGDPYNLKIIFFFFSCILGIGTFWHHLKNGKHSEIFIMGIAFPIFLMIWSTIITSDIASAISGAYPAVLILLVILIREHNINYEKYMMNILQLLAITTIIIVALDMTGVINVNGNNFFRNAFYQYDMGLMGKSYNYAAYYKVFFKASPLLLILLPYCFENNKYIMATITFIALIFSGTRANIFVATIVFLFGFINIWREDRNNRNLRIILGVVIVGVFLVSLPNIITLVNEMMNTAGSISSDQVRIGQLGSFLTVFKDPFNLIFGMGFGSKFYDIGRGAYTSASEMSYFDLLRKIGLPFFLLFMWFVLKPLKWKIGVHLKIAYIGYLLSAITNPLLFSSTGYVLYIYLYSFSRRYGSDIIEVDI